jgi:hypothetical protein
VRQIHSGRPGVRLALLALAVGGGAAFVGLERQTTLARWARQLQQPLTCRAVYDEMRVAFGEERAREVLRRAIRCATVAASAEMAQARRCAIICKSRRFPSPPGDESAVATSHHFEIISN